MPELSVNCPSCRATLTATGKDGDPMLRGRGLVLKADCLAMVCPRCKADVPLGADAMKGLQSRILLYFGMTEKKS